MKSKHLITRILFSLFALALLATVAAAQGTAAKSSKKRQDRFRHGGSAAAELLDINSATKEQLDALPGIGEKYSQKIIDGRPYAKKTDLTRKKVIPGRHLRQDQGQDHRQAKVASQT